MAKSIRQLKGDMDTRFGGKADRNKYLSAIIGHPDGTVYVEDRAGYVWARVGGANGQIIQVYARGMLAAYNLPILIYRLPHRPRDYGIADLDINGWSSTGSGESNTGGYTGAGYVQSHAEQHYFTGGDPVLTHIRAWSPLRVYISSGFTIGVQPGIIPRSGADLEISAQTMSLSAHAPASGALYVLITVDASGVLAATDGTAQPGPGSLSLSDIPDTPSGHFRLAAVRLYANQTALQENRSVTDIVDLRWPQERLASEPLKQFGQVAPNAFLGGPLSGAISEYPTFRTLVIADLPTTVPEKADLWPGLSLFFTDTNTSGVIYELARTYTTAARSDIAFSSVPTGTLCDFEIPASDIDADALLTGVMRAIVWAQTTPLTVPPDGSTQVANSINLSVSFIIRDAGSVETIIGTSAIGTTLYGTMTGQTYTADVADRDILSTDTLIVRLNAAVADNTDTLTVHYYDPNVAVGVYGSTLARIDLPLQEAPSAGVTGSGTPGRVTQWATSSTLGDSTLIKDGAGVLTLSAAGAYTLTIGGTSSINGALSGGGTVATGGFTLTVPATGTATLGTGTSGYVARWTGTNTAGTGVIRDDGTDTGIGIAPNANARLTIDKFFNAATTSYGLNLSTRNDGAGNIIGLQFSVTARDNTKSVAVGVQGSIVSQASSAASSIGELQAVRGRLGHTITNVFNSAVMSADTFIAVSPLITVSGGGALSVTTATGLRVQNQGNSSTANAAGLYIEAQSGATVTNRAITSLGGQLNFLHNADSTLATFTGHSTFAAATPLVQMTRNDANTGAVGTVLTLGANSTGVASAGFGGALALTLESSTTADQTAAAIKWLWTDATHATRTSRADIETTGPGHCAAWGYNGIDGTARTIIANGTGDVTEGITVQYVASEVTGTDTYGGIVYLEPSDTFVINTDGTSALTLTCAADGSVTIARSAGTDTYKFQAWMVWV